MPRAAHLRPGLRLRRCALSTAAHRVAVLHDATCSFIQCTLAHSDFSAGAREQGQPRNESVAHRRSTSSACAPPGQHAHMPPTAAIMPVCSIRRRLTSAMGWCSLADGSGCRRCEPRRVLLSRVMRLRGPADGRRRVSVVRLARCGREMCGGKRRRPPATATEWSLRSQSCAARLRLQSDKVVHDAALAGRIWDLVQSMSMRGETRACKLEDAKLSSTKRSVIQNPYLGSRALLQSTAPRHFLVCI